MNLFSANGVRLFFILIFFSTELSALPNQDLYLEAFLDAEQPWYPGQEGSVVYNIWYKGEIALTKEDLPLLNIAGLEKVGDTVFHEYPKDPYTVQEITQKYRALKPGTFFTPGSEINGIHYVIEGGQKKPVPPIITSKTPSYSITIVAFPPEGKPAAFNGSVGSATFELISPSSLKSEVGDWIPLSIIARDIAPNTVLNFPNIDCLPGFPGFFKRDPNFLEIKEDLSKQIKTFSFKLIALNSLPDEIPPISWTLFNTSSGTYKTFFSEKIPIHLSSIPPIPPKTSITLQSLPPVDSKIAPLASIPFYKPSFFSFQIFFQKHWILLHLLFLTFILGCFWLRRPLKRWLISYRLNPLRRVEKRLQNEKNPQTIARVIERFLREALFKKRFLKKDGSLTPHAPSSAQQTLDFIHDLEKIRFSKGGFIPKESILEKGKHLFRSLFILFLSSSTFLFSETVNEHLKKGNDAATWIERQAEWNLAFQELTDEPLSDSGLKTSSFLLEQFNDQPQALYYLKKAKIHFPLDSSVDSKIQELETKLGVTPVPFTTLPLFLLQILSFLIVGIAFYLFYKKQETWSVFLFVCGYLLVLILFAVPIFTPKSGILLNPSFIYTNTEENKKAALLPLIPGDIVDIVGTSDDLFNIYSPSLEVYGWISQKDVRPLD